MSKTKWVEKFYGFIKSNNKCKFITIIRFIENFLKKNKY